MGLKKDARQYVWMKWYLGGTIRVLEMVQHVFGVTTAQERAAIKEVSMRLTKAYKRRIKYRSN
jgi:hypothetical protein